MRIKDIIALPHNYGELKNALLYYSQTMFYQNFYVTTEDNYVPLNSVPYYLYLKYTCENRQNLEERILYKKPKFNRLSDKYLLNIKTFPFKIVNYQESIEFFRGIYNITLKDYITQLYPYFGGILDYEFNNLICFVVKGSILKNLYEENYFGTRMDNFKELDSKNLTLLVSSRFLEAPYKTAFHWLNKNFFKRLIEVFNINIIITEDIDNLIYNKNNKICASQFKTLYEQEGYAKILIKNFYEQ